MAQVPVIPGFGPAQVAPVARVPIVPVQQGLAPIYAAPVAKVVVPAVAPAPVAIQPAQAGSFSIMCFSWNAAGLKLCETMSQIRADESRSGVRGFLTRKTPCVAPDFFEDIRAAVNLRRPALVVMTTQDEDSSGTYFHAELLPNTLAEINYFLLKRNVFSGVGETASGITLPKIPTGEPRGSALRISIYARSDVISDLRVEERILSRFFSNDGQVQAMCNQGERAAGAIASYVWHPIYGKFAFIAVHIPAGLTALRVGQSLNYPSYRTATKAANILCLLELYNKLVGSLPPGSQPDHIFLLGDMNYDLVIPGRSPQTILTEVTSNATAARIKELQRYDEMRWAMADYPLIGFKEGVAGEGPLFLPTWSLARGRPDTCAIDKTATRIDPTCFTEPDEVLGSIGWHDRILYKELMTSDYMTHCIDYNRIDLKNMHQSMHAGVTAFFEMRATR